MIRLILISILFGTVLPCAKIYDSCCSKIFPVDQPIVPRVNNPGYTYKKPTITSTDNCTTITIDCTGPESELYNLVLSDEKGNILTWYLSNSPIFTGLDYYNKFTCQNGYNNLTTRISCEYGCTEATCMKDTCSCGSAPEFKLEDEKDFFYNPNLTYTQVGMSYIMKKDCAYYYIACHDPSAKLRYKLDNITDEMFGINYYVRGWSSVSQCNTTINKWLQGEESGYPNETLLSQACIVERPV